MNPSTRTVFGREILGGYPHTVRISPQYYDVATHATKKRKIDSQELFVEANESMDFIAERLSVEIAAELVINSMALVPDTMTIIFQNEYQPAATTTDISNQRQVIARLLASKVKQARLKTIENASKEDKTELLEDFIENASTSVDGKKQPDMVQKVYKQSLVLIRSKLKSQNVSEVIEPMSKEARDKTLLMAVNRILATKKNIILEGVDIRMKILTTLAAINPCVKEAVIRYVTDDIRSRIELAFNWLYEQYALLQGFQRRTSLCSMTPEALNQAYNDFLIKLVTSIQSVDGEDRNSLLSRVYLEAPLITDDAIEALKTISSDETWGLAPLQLLKELVIKRSTKQHAFLNILFCCTKHNNSTIKENAIKLLIELNAHPELIKMIHSVLHHRHL